VIQEDVRAHKGKEGPRPDLRFGKTSGRCVLMHPAACGADRGRGPAYDWTVVEDGGTQHSPVLPEQGQPAAHAGLSRRAVSGARKISCLLTPEGLVGSVRPGYAC
jgi:hypothetical protein